MYSPVSQKVNEKFSINKAGPLHYFGNRSLTWPNLDGRMEVDKSLLESSFSVIDANKKSPKFRRCYEPFSGCASWSFAAMELDFADEYIINDSDEALINTLRLIKDKPEDVKLKYSELVQRYASAESKKDFFLDVIKAYNESETLDQKSLILPFIVNHTWGGMIFHDANGNIVYRDINVKGKAIRQAHLDVATLSPEEFSSEVDHASALLKANKVTLKSGDFSAALSDMQEGDFVSLMPPYPETRRARSENSGLYTELYNENILHTKIVQTVESMERAGVEYYMTYGCYEAGMSEFIIKDSLSQSRHFFELVGSVDCAFGLALDQIYFSSSYAIPKSFQSKFIRANDVLGGRSLSGEEAMKQLNHVSRSYQLQDDALALQKQPKKYVIFLSKVFSIRADLNRTQREGMQFYLLATESVINRMDKKQLENFSGILKTSFDQADLESMVGDLIRQNGWNVSSIAIITNDESAIIPAAALREKFGIEGASVKTSELFIDKIKMKERMAEKSVRIPRYVSFDPEAYLQDKDGYVENIFMQFNAEYVFAKPIDSFGSNNVSKLGTKAELRDWCEEHLTAKNYELDEYLVGELFHVDSIVVEGKIVDALPYKFSYPLAEVAKGKPFAVRLMSPEESDYQELIGFNAQVLNALEPLPEGITHLEVFKTTKGEFVFLEIACRPSGGMTSEASQLHSGVNHEEAHYLAQMHLPIRGLIPHEQREMYAAFIFYPKTEGEVISLGKRPDLTTMAEFNYCVKPGDNLNVAQHIMDCVAKGFMKSSDTNLLKREFDYASSLKPVTVYPRAIIARALMQEKVGSAQEETQIVQQGVNKQAK